MAAVTWNPRALRDIDRLETFLWEKNPGAAKEVSTAIVQATRRLEIFPRVGRPADDLDPHHRELMVPFGEGGYVVFYEIVDDLVEILTVRHQREAGY